MAKFWKWIAIVAILSSVTGWNPLDTVGGALAQAKDKVGGDAQAGALVAAAMKNPKMVAAGYFWLTGAMLGGVSVLCLKRHKASSNPNNSWWDLLAATCGIAAAGMALGGGSHYFIKALGA